MPSARAQALGDGCNLRVSREPAPAKAEAVSGEPRKVTPVRPEVNSPQPLALRTPPRPRRPVPADPTGPASVQPGPQPADTQEVPPPPLPFPDRLPVRRIILTDLDRGTVHEFRDVDVRIGREAACELMVVEAPASADIGGVHARLAPRPTGWCLTDERSRGGTFVNHVRLVGSDQAILRTGDVIRLGIGPAARRYRVARIETVANPRRTQAPGRVEVPQGTGDMEIATGAVGGAAAATAAAARAPRNAHLAAAAAAGTVVASMTVGVAGASTGGPAAPPLAPRPGSGAFSGAWTGASTGAWTGAWTGASTGASTGVWTGVWTGVAASAIAVAGAVAGAGGAVAWRPANDRAPLTVALQPAAAVRTAVGAAGNILADVSAWYGGRRVRATGLVVSEGGLVVTVRDAVLGPDGAAPDSVVVSWPHGGRHRGVPQRVADRLGVIALQQWQGQWLGAAAHGTPAATATPTVLVGFDRDSSRPALVASEASAAGAGAAIDVRGASDRLLPGSALVNVEGRVVGLWLGRGRAASLDEALRIAYR